MSADPKSNVVEVGWREVRCRAGMRGRHKRSYCSLGTERSEMRLDFRVQGRGY